MRRKEEYGRGKGLIVGDYRMVLAVMFIDLSRFILNGGENGEGTSMMVSTLSQGKSIILFIE